MPETMTVPEALMEVANAISGKRDPATGNIPTDPAVVKRLSALEQRVTEVAQYCDAELSKIHQRLDESTEDLGDTKEIQEITQTISGLANRIIALEGRTPASAHTHAELEQKSTLLSVDFVRLKDQMQGLAKRVEFLEKQLGYLNPE